MPSLQTEREAVPFFNASAQLHEIQGNWLSIRFVWNLDDMHSYEFFFCIVFIINNYYHFIIFIVNCLRLFFVTFFLFFHCKTWKTNWKFVELKSLNEKKIIKTFQLLFHLLFYNFILVLRSSTLKAIMIWCVLWFDYFSLCYLYSNSCNTKVLRSYHIECSESCAQWKFRWIYFIINLFSHSFANNPCGRTQMQTEFELKTA